MVKPKVVLLIFVSGKIVLTGAKVRFHSVKYFSVSDRMEITQVRDEIYAAFGAIYPVLSEFRKP